MKSRSFREGCNDGTMFELKVPGFKYDPSYPGAETPHEAMACLASNMRHPSWGPRRIRPGTKIEVMRVLPQSQIGCMVIEHAAWIRFDPLAHWDVPPRKQSKPRAPRGFERGPRMPRLFAPCNAWERRWS